MRDDNNDDDEDGSVFFASAMAIILVERRNTPIIITLKCLNLIDREVDKLVVILMDIMILLVAIFVILIFDRRMSGGKYITIAITISIDTYIDHIIESKSIICSFVRILSVRCRYVEAGTYSTIGRY